jgi:hypothetical protein
MRTAQWSLASGIAGRAADAARVNIAVSLRGRLVGATKLKDAHIGNPASIIYPQTLYPKP